MRQGMYLFYFLTICTGLVLAQSQTEFCDIHLFPVDPRNLSIPKIVAQDVLEYTAFYESNKNGLTVEILEIFDGKEKMAIAYQTLEAMVLKTYSNYGNDELVQIDYYGAPEMKCEVKSLRKWYEITPFDLQVVNGKDVPISPLSQLFHKDGQIVFKYTGNSNIIRGIPVNEWKTCIYVSQNITQKITFSFSDPEVWSPSFYDIQFPSIPVQILYEIRDEGQTIKERKEVYTITNFKPYVITETTDQHKNLPEGLYCPGKVSKKPTPPLSNSFRYGMSLVNSFSVQNEEGLISRTMMEYDYDLNLFLYEYNQNNEQIVELHDFNTGIAYYKSIQNGTCKLAPLKYSKDSLDIENGNPKQLRLKTPQEFFNFEGATAQYSGQARKDGMITDVWVGTVAGDVKNSTYEWHFLTTQLDGLSSELSVPYLRIFTQYIYQEIDQKTEPIATYEYYNNYQILSEAVTYNRIMKSCNQGRKYEHYSFRLSIDKKDLVGTYVSEFKLGVLKAMSSIAKVTYVRITDIELVMNDYSPYVIFTINDKTPFYGDVKLPENDVSLTEAVTSLKESFANTNDPIEIDLFLPNDDLKVKISVDQQSFHQVDDLNRNIIRRNVSDLGYSGASIFFLILFASVNGLMLGVLVTMLQKFNIIKLPFLK